MLRVPRFVSSAVTQWRPVDHLDINDSPVDDVEVEHCPSQEEEGRAGGRGPHPGPFHLSAWFAPLAGGPGRLLDAVGFGWWSFTPSTPCQCGYQEALHDAQKDGPSPAREQPD